MKTYEEMAQSVIRRAKTHKTIRNRCILGVTTAVCALGICLGVMAATGPDNKEVPSLQSPATTGPNVTVTDPTVTTPDPTAPREEPRITLLYNNCSDITEMQQDVVSPYRMEIRVKDISGLTEDEANAVCEAEKKYARELIASYPDASNGWQWAQFGGKNTVMTSISAGHFILGMDDPEQVESIYVTVKGVLQLSYLDSAEEDPNFFGTPTKYALDHAQIQQQYYAPCGGIEIGWMFSSELFHTEYDPNPIPLSNYQDTLSITVTFTDGTVENHAIDLVFNDSGEVFAIYRGVTAAA